MNGMKIDTLTSDVMGILNEYCTEVTADVKKEAVNAAEGAVKELRSTSPEGDGSHKGHYKDGWTKAVTNESAAAINVRVYNKKKPTLTHLLEEGHAKQNGGRVEGIPHIAPAEKKAVERFEKALEEVF